MKKYLLSLTEQQIHAGISSDSQGALVIERRFESEPIAESSPVFGMYFDTANDKTAEERLRVLQRKTIPDALVPTCIMRHTLKFSNGIDLKDPEHISYLRNFLDQTCNAIVDVLDQVAERHAVVPNSLVDESLLHLNFAKVRSDRFSPTNSSSAALAKIEKYLQGPGGQALVMVGRSGGGKTYAMARAFVTRSAGNAVVRFLGTSSKSADVLSLLQSVCQQLYIISKGKGTSTSGEGQAGLGPCPAGFQELCQYFKEALNQWAWAPLVLFLDSVDQLDDSNSGRNLEWLPLSDFSTNVHVVISTLPDEVNPEVGLPFRCLSNLKRHHPNPKAFIEVELLKDAESLMKHLLNLKGRKLQAKQMKAVMKAVELSEDKAQTPLMITLLAHLVGEWSSGRDADASLLPTSVRTIIFEFFGILEKKFGYSFVAHIMSIITIARQGVTMSELLEILSLDDEVLAAAHEWWSTPERKMPSGPLALLLADLDSFLSHRGQKSGGELLFWYHRQLWEAAEARYLKDLDFRSSMHRMLSQFFCGKWCGKAKPYSKAMEIRVGLSSDEKSALRHVREQPLHLKGTSVWHPDAEYNERRCVEALHHMVKELEILNGRFNLERRDAKAARLKRIKECMEIMLEEFCSVEGVCARGMVGEVFRLVSQGAKLMRLCADGKLASAVNVDLVKAEHFNRWIRRDAYEFVSAPGVALSALRQPLISKAREDFLSSRSHVQGFPWFVLGVSDNFDPVMSVLKGHQSSVNCTDWFGGKLVSGDNDGVIMVWDDLTGEKLFELKGHTRAVNSVAWSRKGDKIASGSADRSIIIWDATTGDKVSELEGHTNWVNSVTWSPKGDQIVYVSDDMTIIIRDATTGNKISKLQGGHTNYVWSVAWSRKGDKIASGSADRTIIIWDAKTGNKVSELKGHTGGVNSVAWSPEGDQIASGSSDNTLIIWDAKTGDRVSKLKGHTDTIRSVAWSRKGDQIASGSHDKTIIIWDATTGEKVSKLKGHTSDVMSIAWSPERDQLASGSGDKTIIIWDATTGDKVSEPKGHTEAVKSVAWSPEGDQIASGSDDDTIIIWDATTGNKVSKLKGHTREVSSVAWSPKGDQIASGSRDQTIIIWDATTGDKVSELKGHTSWVNSAAWSPEGDKIASGSGDKTIIIWDAKTGDKVSKFKGQAEAVNSALRGIRSRQGQVVRP